MQSKSFPRRVMHACIAYPLLFACWGMAGVLSASIIAGAVVALYRAWQTRGMQAFLPSLQWMFTVVLASFALGLHFAAIESVKVTCDATGRAFASIRTCLIMTLMATFTAGAVEGVLQAFGLVGGTRSFAANWVLCSAVMLASAVHLFRVVARYQDARKSNRGTRFGHAPNA